MSVIEIHHTTGTDTTTSHLRAVLRGHELARFELRWPGHTTPSTSVASGHVEIRRLTVDLDAHGRGVVGRLFDRLLALGLERGIRHLDITVHHAGVGTCREIGFRPTGDGFWDGARRYVPMTLDLAAWSGSRARSAGGLAIARLARSRLLESPSPEADVLTATA